MITIVVMNESGLFIQKSKKWQLQVLEQVVNIT